MTVKLNSFIVHAYFVEIFSRLRVCVVRAFVGECVCVRARALVRVIGLAERRKMFLSPTF